jgi:hypothetical protein
VTQITAETGKHSDLDECVRGCALGDSEDRKIGVGVVLFVGL